MSENEDSMDELVNEYKADEYKNSKEFERLNVPYKRLDE